MCVFLFKKKKKTVFVGVDEYNIFMSFLLSWLLLLAYQKFFFFSMRISDFPGAHCLHHSWVPDAIEPLGGCLSAFAAQFPGDKKAFRPEE